MVTVSRTVKIMGELCIYFVSKGPLTENYHSMIFFSSNMLVHCYNNHFWPHLLVLAVCCGLAPHSVKLTNLLIDLKRIPIVTSKQYIVKL